MEGPIGDAARANLSRELIVVPVANQLSLFTEKWNHTEYFIHMKRMFNRLADRAAQDIPDSGNSCFDGGKPWPGFKSNVRKFGFN